MSVSQGLDKIITRILEQAAAQAADEERIANDEAERILAAARKEAAGIVSAAEEKAAAASAVYAERRKNTDEQQRKLTLLKVRNTMIDEVLKEACGRILALDDEAYFAMILKLFAERVAPGDGELRMNERDLARMPRDLEAQAQQTAAAAGGTVRIASEPVKIDGGFILVYGDIEENCSLSAVFSARREEFRDRVYEILFR